LKEIPGSQNMLGREHHSNRPNSSGMAWNLGQ
jgi:hypothetical protein